MNPARRWSLFPISALLSSTPVVAANESIRYAPMPAVAITVVAGHPWRPPFGLARVGAPFIAHIEWKAAPPPVGEYFLVTYRAGQEGVRYPLNPKQGPPPAQRHSTYRPSYFAHAVLKDIPDEVALLARCGGRTNIREIARHPVIWPPLEVDAQARPEQPVNPVDLGTILVPHDQQLLSAGQHVVVDVAVFAHTRDLPQAHRVRHLVGTAPLQVPFAIAKGHRRVTSLHVPLTSSDDTTVLTVSLRDGDRVLWKKAIRTMVVSKAPRAPTFGAIETKLRSDEPILTADPETGEPRLPIPYNTAWDPKRNDVVVFLPNRSRFVFWRGASYIPFWATPYNTGVS